MVTSWPETVFHTVRLYVSIKNRSEPGGDIRPGAENWAIIINDY